MVSNEWSGVRSFTPHSRFFFTHITGVSSEMVEKTECLEKTTKFQQTNWQTSSHLHLFQVGFKTALWLSLHALDHYIGHQGFSIYDSGPKWVPKAKTLPVIFSQIFLKFFLFYLKWFKSPPYRSQGLSPPWFKSRKCKNIPELTALNFFLKWQFYDVFYKC